MRGLLIALGWIATVGGAFFLGRTVGAPAPEAPPAAVVRPPDRATADPGPMLAPGASDVREGAGSGATGRGGTRAPSREDPWALKPGETLAPFTLEDVDDPDEAMSRILRHVAALLARGEAGHLELLRFLDEAIVDDDELERIFEGSDEQMARYIVPMIEFLVHRKGQVVGVIESVFRTMAESPETYADFDDDTLEIFTEGAAVILPGAVGEKELARYRSWARTLLETPEGSLPEPVEKQRRRLQQALLLWAPRLSTEDALTRLRAGTLKGREAVQALRRLPAEQLAELDLVGILQPVVAQMDYRTLRALRDMPLQPRDLDVLDRTVLDAAAKGQARDWAIIQYLGATGRQRWPAPQALLEEGFRRGGSALETCAQALTRLGGQVPAEYLRWVLDTYEPSDRTRRSLQAAADRK